MISTIIENEAKLKQWQIDKINNVVLGNEIPWYYSGDSVYGDGINYYSHVLIHRKEQNNNKINNSPLTNFFVEILTQILNENQIIIKEILRASLNATFYNNRNEGTVHLDHEFVHNNFIMYLDNIENSGTVIYKDTEKTKKYVSQSKKFNYIIFPGLYHAQLFPPPGERRTVFVATFT